MCIRDSLLAALTGILSSPLTVIEAPMGYGKTVAVREFLRRENLAVIWVSVLDSPDGAFWRSLCREFERLPETAETARALRRLGPPFAPDDACLLYTSELQRDATDEPAQRQSAHQIHRSVSTTPARREAP